MLVISILAPAVAAFAQNRTATPSSHPNLKLERHLTLAPTSGNPRNSEGDFIHLKDGRWLFIYTHFTGGANDHAKAFLASRQSSDNGKTWSDKDQLVVANDGGFNVMSVSLLRLKSGEIALFYLRKNSLHDCRPVLRLSRDEAKTWSDPIECITDEVGYYVLNNSRVIQLVGGRLVMPTALHTFDGKRLQPGKIVVYLSDDAGRTWRRSRTILNEDASGTRINLMEPGVVEISQNRILMVIRTNLAASTSAIRATKEKRGQSLARAIFSLPKRRPHSREFPPPAICLSCGTITMASPNRIVAAAPPFALRWPSLFRAMAARHG
jgi:hypothetical protein